MRGANSRLLTLVSSKMGEVSVDFGKNAESVVAVR